MKKMMKPPAPVKVVMEAICVLFGIKPERRFNIQTMKNELDYWKPSFNLMGDGSLLKSLIEYDKDQTDRKAVIKAKKVMAGTSLEKLANASKAALGLGKWVNAICLYSDLQQN